MRTEEIFSKKREVKFLKLLGNSKLRTLYGYATGRMQMHVLTCCGTSCSVIDMCGNAAILWDWYINQSSGGCHVFSKGDAIAAEHREWKLCLRLLQRLVDHWCSSCFAFLPSYVRSYYHSSLVGIHCLLNRLARGVTELMVQIFSSTS